MNNTNKIEVNTPHPNFLGSLNVATIPIIPANKEDAIERYVEIADSAHANPAINHRQNGTRSIHQNQFFIPTILNQI